MHYIAVENTVAVFILTLMAWHRELLKHKKWLIDAATNFSYKMFSSEVPFFVKQHQLQMICKKLIFLLSTLRDEKFETKYFCLFFDSQNLDVFQRFWSIMWQIT